MSHRQHHLLPSNAGKTERSSHLSVWQPSSCSGPRQRRRRRRRLADDWEIKSFISVTAKQLLWPTTTTTTTPTTTDVWLNLKLMAINNNEVLFWMKYYSDLSCRKHSTKSINTIFKHIKKCSLNTFTCQRFCCFVFFLFFLSFFLILYSAPAMSLTW